MMVAASHVPLTGDYLATCVILAQLSPVLQNARQLHNSALQLVLHSGHSCWQDVSVSKITLD